MFSIFAQHTYCFLLMGIFSRLFKKEEPQPLIIPSMEEQERIAKANLDSYLGHLFQSWNETEDEFRCDYFNIAGITYHCSRSDVGMIRGVTFKDHNNPKDKSAIGIIDIDSTGKQKFLGYISKEDKRRFKKFTEDTEQAAYIGYIKEFEKENGFKGIMGVIKVYAGDPTSKKAYQMMLKDFRVLYGVFHGYFEESSLADEGLKPEWILERHL